MPNTLVRVPDVTVIPGTPSIAAQPRRCYQVQIGTRTVTYQTTEQVLGPPQGTVVETSNDLTNPFGSQFTLIPVEIPSDYQGVELGAGTTQTVTKTRREPVYEERCTEAVEGVQGTPTEVIEDYGPDWKATARSLVFHPANASFKFTPVDVVIGGLASAVALEGARLSQVAYGVLANADGNLQLVFNGAVQSGTIGALSTYTELEVYTLGGRSAVRGYDGADWIELAQDSVAVGDEVFAVGLVHRKDSEIDAPEFTALSIAEESPTGGLSLVGEITFSIASENPAVGSLPLKHQIAEKVGDVFAIPARGSLPLSSTVGTSITRIISVDRSLGLAGTVSEAVAVASEIRIPKQEFFAGNRKGAVAELEVPKPTLDAGTDDGAPTFALSGARLTSNRMAFAATGLAGGIGGAELEIAPQQLYASEEEYAEGEVQVPKPFIIAGGFSGDSDEARNLDFLLANGRFSANASLFVAFDSDLGVSGDASVLIIMDSSLESALDLGSDLSFVSLLNAAIEDGLFLRDGQQMQAPDQIQYVYNLLSGAVSRFDGFDFKGMVSTDHGTYGYTSTGVYKIVDSPSLGVSALVDFGKTAFGTSAAKHIDTVFIGLRADGAVFLSMDNGAQEKTYRVIAREPTMRTKTGRGLTGREWGVKLQLLDVTRAQLDDVEFVVAASPRRWTR